MTFELFLFLVFVTAPLGHIIHELGHAVSAKGLGASHVTFSIGAGKRLYQKESQHLTILIHKLFFIGGMAHSQRLAPFQKYEVIIISASGPLASMLVVCLSLGLYTFCPSNYLMLIILFNAWIALINLIPFRRGNKQSDGYAIFEAMKNK